MATSNSKSFLDLPMSTKIMRLFFELWNMQLFLFFNPFTLWLINLFAPRCAVCIAHDDDLYGETSQKFFTRQAKKWPWYWAKWWYTYTDIKCLSVKHQIDFYNNVDTSPHTLSAMSISAVTQILNDNFVFFKENVGSIKMSPELFLVFIQKSMEQNDWSALADYLKRGTLQKDLAVTLACEVSRWSLIKCDKNFITGVFLDYIERCGLSDELRREIRESVCDEDFRKDVAKRLKIYDQRVFTKSQRGTKQTDAWLKFCETTKDICLQAQIEMGVDQYYIFHATGHQLDAAAVLHILLHNPYAAMKQMVFEFEPNFGVVSGNIEDVLLKNPTLQNIRAYVIANAKDRQSAVSNTDCRVSE